MSQDPIRGIPRSSTTPDAAAAGRKGARTAGGSVARVLTLAALATVTLGLAGCGKPQPNAKAEPPAVGTAAAPDASARPALSLGNEDVLVLDRRSGAVATVVTGSLQAERRADLRAEVGSVVMRVMRDNGETVRRGELLVKLDDAAIRDSLGSAEEAERAAARSAEGAERQFQRLKSLQAQGMTSQQALEDAEVRRNVAASERVAAAARMATARQQLERTEVRAPFDGVVSARKVSSGDTAGVGKELIQVIDPSSVRFDAFAAAEQVGALRVGQPVSVKVQGRESAPLAGRIRRIDAVAQPLTRQVAVIVDLTGAAGLIPGLYAEGEVAVPAPQVMALPETAVVRRGEQTIVWKLQERQLRAQVVQLKPRDARTGLFEVISGLQDGDRVLRAPGSRPQEGQAFEMRAAPAAAKPVPAASSATSSAASSASRS